MAEFYRMCDDFDWKKEDKERVEARSLLKDAMAQQFNNIYGTDVDDVISWQNLCSVLGIVPIPDALVPCRNVSISHAKNLT
jgi:hypothetical protein